MDITPHWRFSSTVKIRPWTTSRESSVFHPLPILYQLFLSFTPLSSLFLSAGPEPAHTPVPFPLSWSHLSSCVSLCQSLSRFTPIRSSLYPPSPSRNGFRWANFISVMPLVCNSQFGFSGKWPPLFIEGLFIWTTWLLCPNPEITLGWLWKGWCVGVIR